MQRNWKQTLHSSHLDCLQNRADMGRLLKPGSITGLKECYWNHSTLLRLKEKKLETLHIIAESSDLSIPAVRHSKPLGLSCLPSGTRCFPWLCILAAAPALAIPGPLHAQIPDAPPSLTCPCSINSNVQARSHPKTPAGWALAEDLFIKTLAQEALKQDLQSHNSRKNDKNTSAGGDSCPAG